MLESLVQQAAMTFAQQLGAELIANPEEAMNQLNQLAEALFCPHHTAADVAQDALDAWEVGELSDEAAMQVVAAVIGDLNRQRSQTSPRTVTVSSSPLDKFRTPEQQRRAAQVHTDAANYFARRT